MLQRPKMGWIRFAGPCAGSGNKQDALRAEHSMRLVHSQIPTGGLIMIEASERSQVWNLQIVKECMLTLHETVHKLCRYESLSNSLGPPCNSSIRLLPTFKCRMAVSVNVAMSSTAKPSNWVQPPMPDSNKFFAAWCIRFAKWVM